MQRHSDALIDRTGPLQGAFQNATLFSWHVGVVASLRIARSAFRKFTRSSVQPVGVMFEWIFQNSLDAILLTVPDGRILLANPAAAELFGWSVEEICAGGRELIVDMSDP